MESRIIDPSTNRPVDYKTIPITAPIDKFTVGETFKIKGIDWQVANISGAGLILVPPDGVRTEERWRCGELIPLKGYWFRVGIVRREGIAIAATGERAGDVD